MRRGRRDNSVFSDAEFTIAVVLPEGNRGFVVCCGLEAYFGDAIFG